MRTGIGIVALLAGIAAGFAQAGSGMRQTPATSRFCDRQQALTAGQQDRLLRFSAVVRDTLTGTDSNALLISRSGLDLSRFGIRYSHAAIAWRASSGEWSARQLYYACDESRPRIYDQGMAGFTMGIDDPSLGYISIVKLPPQAAQALLRSSQDTALALRLLATNYSANAYAYSLSYQNCNQWLVELFATALGHLPDGDGLRSRAQRWLRQAGYAPEPVDVGSHALMFAANFVPLLHLDDHPADDQFAMKLKVSLPATIETFIRQQLPDSERLELCHDGKQVVVHRGWTPIADRCRPGAEDQVVPLD